MDIQKTLLYLVAATIGVGVVVSATSSGMSDQTSTLSESINRDLAGSGSRIGPANARVQIVEFSDFQCPFCRRLDATLRSLMQEHPGQIAVAFHYFPLERIHPQALAAAVAAECANRLGMFASMNAALFDAQDSLSHLRWVTFAQRAGVADTVAFDRCLRDRAASETVRADIARGEALMVRSTPTVFVNGRRFNGAPRAKVLRDAVEAGLRQ
jgi:protein-disulfide isomerase